MGRREDLIELANLARDQGDQELELKALSEIDALQPAPVQDVGMGDALGAGFQRGVEEISGGFGQRIFEGLTSFNRQQLQALADGISSGEIPATEENIQRFDQLSSMVNEAERTLSGAQDVERAKREEFAPIQEAAPIASTIGRVGGQLLPSMAIPAVTAPTLGGRMALGAATGGTLGALQPTVEDESVAENVAIGAVFGGAAPPVLEKVALPIVRGATAPVVNFIKGVFSKPGTQTDSARTIAQQYGEAFDDISQAVSAQPGKQPEQVARAAAFEEAGINPAARSRITRNPDDFQRELQLLRQRDSEAADKLRDNYYQESREIQDSVQAIADSLGISSASGRSIKESLDAIQSSMSANRRAAYEDLATAVSKSPKAQIDSIPLNTSQIVDSVEDAQRRFMDDATSKKIDELMAEFGLLGEQVGRQGRFSIVDFDGQPIRVRGEITPLNIGNMEEFRKRINQAFNISDPRQSAARKQITQIIDQEVDTLADGLSDAGVGSDIINKARKARGLAREEKLIFDQGDIIDRLTSVRPGTVTPLVESSRVMGAVKNAPTEQVNKLISTLSKTPEGKEAISNMGSSIVVDLLEAATKAGSRQLSGPGGAQIVDFSGNNFTKAINSYGKTKTDSRRLLRKVLGEEAYKKMLRLEKIGQIRIAPETAVQKGSAPDLINQFIRASNIVSKRIPIIGGKISDTAESIAKAREAAQVTNIKPDDINDETKDFILVNAPKVAALLGLTQNP